MQINFDSSGSLPVDRVERDGLDGATILIVEDEALLAHDMALTIEESGGRAEGPIHRLEDAMRRADVEALDAAILDVDIAGTEVFAFADRLEAAGVPIVFHTARADATRLRARYPQAEILSKPCLARGVVAALRSVLSVPGASPRAAS